VRKKERKQMEVSGIWKSFQVGKKEREEAATFRVLLQAKNPKNEKLK